MFVALLVVLLEFFLSYDLLLQYGDGLVDWVAVGARLTVCAISQMDSVAQNARRACSTHRELQLVLPIRIQLD